MIHSPHYDRETRTVAPLLDRLDAVCTVAAAELGAKDRDHIWTEGQRAVAKSLLTSTAAVTDLQGSAVTAKATTVLAA